ncbi:hypothetical protein I552_0655 [Mycobacterium xenopi 3993]|nr:hypothetical protein I552_0655 [Mycobacterium xenopi 3993]
MGGFHRDAVSAHPRAVQVRQTEQALLNAAARRRPVIRRPQRRQPRKKPSCRSSKNSR